ncbi:MAG TPA: hypothetical protein DHW02_02695 [Ktedonobacter sp.]|nr:hypothetical protein [Ktedonobacter sp.]
MGQNDELVSALPELLATDLHRNFERLVLAYQDRLYAFVLLRVHNAHIAEELVLDAFERAYYALKSYPVARIRLLRLEPWLYEITRNVYYNYLRTLRTKDARLPSVPLDLSEDSTAFNIADTAPEPDEEVCRNENRDELHAYIETLPLRYQETVKLYYFEHFSYDDIAKHLHQPVGTVKSNIHRATQLLRQYIHTQIKEVR